MAEDHLHEIEQRSNRAMSQLRGVVAVVLSIVVVASLLNNVVSYLALNKLKEQTGPTASLRSRRVTTYLTNAAACEGAKTLQGLINLTPVDKPRYDLLSSYEPCRVAKDLANKLGIEFPPVTPVVVPLATTTTTTQRPRSSTTTTRGGGPRTSPPTTARPTTTTAPRPPPTSTTSTTTCRLVRVDGVCR